MNCTLPAKHWVESVGNVVVSVFDYFFAQGYFYVRIALWRQDGRDVISSWVQTEVNFRDRLGSLLYSQVMTKVAAGRPEEGLR